mgnify:CR=1 FL=1
MGFTMLTVLVAIRNFTVAILLTWMGFSVAPDGDDKNDSAHQAPNSSAISFFAG